MVCFLCFCDIFLCFIIVIEIEIDKFSKCLVFLQSVTLHTNLGDIKCEIFCDEVPRTAEGALVACSPIIKSPAYLFFEHCAGFSPSHTWS
ncbi:hypothetical protein H5410_039642 [Solanum commersonii]|uniref:Secreted protein n=1 Tax=Solanum commersonii TaxID=4109 RepID=A0A9J5XPU1_SOLCO|nr:hypothetical protein H5410_039642 [Solanum commersonii]